MVTRLVEKFPIFYGTQSLPCSQQPATGPSSEADESNQLTNSMEQSPFSEANSHSACQEITCLLWNPRFITVFTRVRHWSLSWARCIHSTLFHPISL